MTETPGQMMARKQESGEHWTLKEYQSLSILYPEGPLKDMDEADLRDMVEVSECAFDGTPDCIACQAAIELAEQTDPSPESEPTDSQLKEWESEGGFNPSPQKWDGNIDVKTEFLNSLDVVHAKAVALFDTHVALGPVNREELALLVSSADRYLQLLDTMQHAGITVLTDEQKEEVDALQTLMVKVK